VELSMTEGTIVLEHDRVITADTREPYDEPVVNDAADGNASASSPVVSDGRGHQRLIADFIEAIACDRAPTCDGTEGRRSLAVAEAMYESARSGRIVEVQS
jgi:predicted dehydrogenase